MGAVSWLWLRIRTMEMRNVWWILYMRLKSWRITRFCLVATSCLTLCDPWTATCQASPSFTISWNLLKLMSIESVMPSNHLILCFSLRLLPSVFPSIRVFSNVSSSHQGWLKYWRSNEYSFQWIFRIDFLYDWLVWSPCCSRDSQESSPASQFESINSSALSLLYGSTLASIHDYWKNHNFDYTDLHQQSDVSVFLICCLGLP